MIPSAKFVDRSIVHQLGDREACVLSYDSDTLDTVLGASSDMTLAWDSARNSVYSVNGWSQDNDQVRNSNVNNAYKTTGALECILKAGAKFDFLLDMQDHRARKAISPDGHGVPLFTFNRGLGRPTGHVLWPLPIYQDVENDEFLGGLDPERVPWNLKRDVVVWRGGAGNRGRLGRHARGGPIRMVPLLRQFKNDKMSAEETERVLLSMPRYKTIHRYIADERFDIGFTNADGLVLKDEPFLNGLERPRIQRQDFQLYKYILVLPGSDVGSSFYWTMNSGSVGLVFDCDFESFASHHFKPWEHYVPIRKSLGNMEKALEWCEKNQEECQEMARRAAEVCRLLARQDLREKIQQGIVGGLNDILPKGAKGWTHLE